MLRLVFTALGKTSETNGLSMVVGDNELVEDPCALNQVHLPFRWLRGKIRKAFYKVITIVFPS